MHVMKSGKAFFDLVKIYTFFLKYNLHSSNVY